MKKTMALVLIMIFAFTACTSSEQRKLIEDQKSELEAIRKEQDKLLEEVEIAQEEEEKLREEVDTSQKLSLELQDKVNLLESEKLELIDELKAFEKMDDEDLELVRFFDYYDPEMLTSDYQPTNQMASLKSETGLRILPSNNAPFINRDGVSFENSPIERDSVMVHAFFNSKVGKGWAFISYDYFTSGFVLASELMPYKREITRTYEPAEQFRDFKIGTTADEIQTHFDWNTTMVKDRNGFLYVIRVANEENPGDRDIDFWFHPSDRRIDVINTNSELYPLESGFKVGDKAEDVFAYYDELYVQSEYFNSDSYRRYNIGNGYSLDFSVSDEGIITFIMINGGMYSYA